MLMRVTVACVLGVFGFACRPSHESLRDLDVAAHVAGHRITLADLEAEWRQRRPAEYARARQDIYRMRRAVLDDLIGDALVTNEVQRLSRSQSMLVAQAVESGLIAGAPAIVETEIAELYERSGAAEYGIELETLRPEFVKALQERRTIATADRYRDHLRANRDVRIVLDPPRTTLPVIPSNPVRGASDSPIRIVEFADFHCQFCRRTRAVLEQLVKKYAGQVQWIWKDYPLGSSAAALAAACAHDQGRFWAYHDVLFDRQEEIPPDADGWLLALAGELGLHEGRFRTCVAEGRHRDRIASDVAAGREAGVTGTPTVFVNGRMIMGAQPLETLEQVVIDELELIETRN